MPIITRARRLTVQTATGLALLMSLVGCGSGDDLARSIGLTRDAPDEFTVTTRAPLSMPPDFSIKPPQPGASRPQERSASASAAAALSPQTALSSASKTSPGEQALLAASGPQAPSGIRTDVNKEAHLDAGNPSFTDRLMFWKAAPQAGTVVDPTKESQRLHENAALGQPTQAGDTPIIQPKSTPLLNSLLGNVF